MIVGVGCDIIEIERIARAIKSESFIRRVFTAEEAAYCQRRGQQAAASFAARFAAKEAVLKALGTGLREGSLQEIAVDNDGLGKPLVQLSGHFAMLAKQLGVKNIQISLSHSRELATAYVIMEDGK
ncbi:MAG TPA: holo-[acyl-carrier-protein] synthase [Phascolarctobacterium succinatutens]|jgi:holo-[acyl-carrier protein] synthase|uniref:holo-ACP synthase n=1 Tax=Phascolarctobacterium succinatutens TaxID=626940 RepID=UPI000ED0782A|nr:holo-ACP synthase [Phascolarctobacterium succinatutens]HAM92487.1 holo-[acyl-carrier-protein] synthase [Phascolarctobacterium succinatutens]